MMMKRQGPKVFEIATIAGQFFLVLVKPLSDTFSAIVLVETLACPTLQAPVRSVAYHSANVEYLFGF